MEDIITEDISEKFWYKEYMLKNKYIIPYLERFWSYNVDMGKTFRALVEYAAVSGDLVLYLAPDRVDRNVQIVVFDSEHVEIIPDEFNAHKIKRAVVEYDYEDEEGIKHSYSLEADSEKVTITEDGKITTTPHSLGEVPIVHIAFNRSSKSVYGRSDVYKLLAGSYCSMKSLVTLVK